MQTINDITRTLNNNQLRNSCIVAGFKILHKTIELFENQSDNFFNYGKKGFVNCDNTHVAQNIASLITHFVSLCLLTRSALLLRRSYAALIFCATIWQ